MVYWIECKYQSYHTTEVREFAQYQIDRYRDVQGDSHYKVLLALGEGGTPTAPDAVYLVPLDSVKDFTVSRATLNLHRVRNPERRLPYVIKDYFYNQVFNRK